MGVEFRRLVWPCRAKQTDYEGIGDKLLYASLIQEAVRGGQPRGTTCNRLPNLIFTVAMPTLNPPILSLPPLLDFRVIRLSLYRDYTSPLECRFFFPVDRKKKSAWSADGVRNSPDSFPSCVRTNGTPIRQQQKKREKEKKYVYRGSGNVGHGLPFFFLLLEGGLAARQCLLGLTYFLTRLRCCCRRLATTQKRGGAVVFFFFSGGSLDDVLLVYQNNRKNVISRELLSHDLYLTYEEERSGRMWTPRGGKFFFSEVRRRRRAQS